MCPQVPDEPTLMGEVPGTRKGGEDEAGNRSYTLVFEVWAPKEYGTRKVAAVSPFRRGDYYRIGEVGDDWYEADTGALCLGPQADQKSDDGTKWHITCNFGQPQLNSGNGSEDAPWVLYDVPTLAPASWRWDAEDYEEIVDKDISGNPIVNTAGDKPVPALTRNRTRSILVVDQLSALTEWDDSYVELVQNHTNNATFGGRAAKLWYCRKISGVIQWHTVIGACVAVHGEFVLRPEGWKSKPLNDGTRQLVGGVHRPCMSPYDGGTPVSQPVPLAVDGSQLPPGGTINYLEFEVIPTADYGMLNLRLP